MFSSFDQGLKFLIENEVVVFIRKTVYARSSFYVKTYQTVSFKGNYQTGYEAQTFEMVAALTPETHVGAFGSFRVRIACFFETADDYLRSLQNRKPGRLAIL